jgi:hypothetical protein
MAAKKSSKKLSKGKKLESKKSPVIRGLHTI